MALVDNLIKIARAEIGVHEGRKNGSWNNDQKYSNEVPGLAWSDFQPWCATFVSWVAFKGGASELYPRTASCDVGGAWFKTKGRWSEYPAIGAQVFYGTARDLNHTGIVVDYDDIYILTVEGNTNDSGSREGDGVYLKKRLRRATNVIGYGYPAFTEGIKSADPAWKTGFKTKAPVTVNPTPGVGQLGRIDGVDLSHHNSGITASGLKKAKAAGVRFVFHKCTEGTGFEDVQYNARRRLCAAAGLPFGAYHFARPSKSSGTAQAKQFLAKAQLKPGDLLPVLDLEDQGGLGIAALTKWVGDFVRECERQLGAGGIVYTNFHLTNHFGWKLWAARYNNAMAAPAVAQPWHAYDIWQFSNGVAGRPATVPGIGACDINMLAWKPKPKLAKIRIPMPKATKPPVVKPPVTKPPVVKPPVVKPPVVVVPPVVPVEVPQFRNVQVNVQQTDPLSTVTRHIVEVAGMGDVIGWNELGTEALVNAVKALPGFSHYGPNPSAAAVAISWRTEMFQLVDAGTIVVHAGVPHITPTRVINWVRLQHLASSKVFTRINTQVVHHIEVAGLPRVKGALSGQNARAKTHFQMLYDAIAGAAHFGPVVTGGDFNVDYYAEKALPPSKRCAWFPYTKLGKVAKPVMSGGTHGARGIDWTLLSGAVTAVGQTVLPHRSSDHNPVLTVVGLA